MPEIVLSTLNAKYPHSAFGLRYLMANLGELQPRCRMLEFEIRQRPVEIVEKILALRPGIVGLGVYIWNVSLVGRVVAMLKRIRPEVTIVIGGPEVGYGPTERELVRDADYLICGEADLAFAELCRRLTAGERPSSKTICAEQNLRFLRSRTGVHVHADLIVGLPGEDIARFAAGFDRLVDLRPNEIQVGILKRLHGTPIGRHDREWSMVYDPCPPYEVLQTSLIDFATMQRLRRFARYWDLVANSGNFLQTAALIWDAGSPFWSFLDFSDWLYERLGRTHAIALVRLCEMLFDYLTARKGLGESAVAAMLYGDYRRGGRPGLPEFLRGRVALDERTPEVGSSGPARQARHWSRGGNRARSLR